MTGRHRRPSGLTVALQTIGGIIAGAAFTGRHRRPRGLTVALRSIGGAVAGAAVIGSAATTAGTAVALTAALTSSQVATAGVVTQTLRAGLGGTPTTAYISNSAYTPSTAGSLSTASSLSISALPAAVGTPVTGTALRALGTPDRDRDPSSAAAREKDAGRRTASATVRPGRSETSAPQTAAAVVTAETAQRTEPEFRPPAHRVTADDVIGFAAGQVGVREDAAGSTKYQEWYAASPRAKETARRNGGRTTDYLTASWCDIFVSWLGEQTGTGRSMGSDAYTVEHALWFVAEGRWGDRPRAGALAFFAWETDPSLRDIAHVDHVALVVKDNGDGTIETIEGNTRNAVERRIRPATAVAGYGYPDFAG